MAGNANRGSTGENYTPEEKAGYYRGKADSELDPIIKQHYANKAAYWGKVSQGQEVTPEEEKAYGPHHKKGPIDDLIFAKRTLAKTVDPEKKAQWQAQVDYLEKVASGQEVSALETAERSVYQGMRKPKMVGLNTSERRLDSRKANALKVAEAICNGTFPAFGNGQPVGADGKITFIPHSARLFTTGIPLSGINQFVIQIAAAERGWVPEKDGHIYLATEDQCGFLVDNRGKRVPNLKPNARPFIMVTSGNADKVSRALNLKDKGLSLDQLDANAKSLAYEKVAKVYKVYNSNDMVDPFLSEVGSNLDAARPKDYNHPQMKPFDASGAKTPAEYFAIYKIACRYGAPFATTQEKAAEMKVLASKELEEAYSKGLDGMVYKWDGKINDTVKTMLGEIKAQHEQERDDERKLKNFELAAAAGADIDTSIDM